MRWEFVHVFIYIVSCIVCPPVAQFLFFLWWFDLSLDFGSDLEITGVCGCEMVIWGKLFAMFGVNWATAGQWSACSADQFETLKSEVIMV